MIFTNASIDAALGEFMLVKARQRLIFTIALMNECKDHP